MFHIVRRGEWEAAVAAGRYAPASLAGDGFIHLSTSGQWPRVLRERFTGGADLLLLEIDPSRLEAEVRWENTEGGDELFPHLYGPLDPAAVIAVHALST